jgi:hypothetical protein
MIRSRHSRSVLLMPSLGRIDAFVTKAIFKRSLRKRAYSREDFARMAAATPFGGREVTEGAIGFDVLLTKQDKTDDCQL